MTIQKSAVFSKCRTYRYELRRYWDGSKPPMQVIGLNPSTADEQDDDPTIRRLIGFARAWGFGGIRVTNLFAFRATSPKVMLVQDNPVGQYQGEQNDVYIYQAALVCRMVLACWGVHGIHNDRAKAVLKLLRKYDIHCLGLTANGQPRHPLYLPKKAEPEIYRPKKTEVA